MKRASLRSSWPLLLLPALLLVLLGTDCAGPPRTSPSLTDPSPFAGRPEAQGSLRFALRDSLDMHLAPLARNPSEELVYRQFYETLVVVDDRGRLRAGLAKSWQSKAEGRIWTFRLRRDLRFWDGSDCEAMDILAGWLRTRQLAQGEKWPEFFRVLEPLTGRVKVAGGDRLEIRLTEPCPQLPRLLAQPVFALVAARPGLAWPLGTGPARPAFPEQEAGRELLCLPNPYHPEPASWGLLSFLPRPQADPRDLLADADLFLLDQSSLIPYFLALPALRVSPLAWDLLHVLAIGPQVPPGLSSHWPDSSLLADLAREVLVSEGAAALGSEPIRDSAVLAALLSPACADPAGHRAESQAIFHQGQGSARLLYPQGEADSRVLAERIAALRGMGEALWPGLEPLGEELVLLGLGPADLADSLAATNAAALLPLGFAPLAPDWVYRELIPECAVVYPLLWTRSQLVHRDGICGLSLAGDGVLLLHGAGWRKGASP